MTPPPLTAAQLRAVCQSAPMRRLLEYAPLFNASLAGGDVLSRARCAMYLAQLAHESGEFRYLAELDDGWRYEGRHDLGNVQPGDGARFKGRGVIQITGRHNYTAAGADLGLPLVERPELAAVPVNAFRIAAWFWRKHGCNEPADRGDVRACTRIINGGFNGLEQRTTYFKRACTALGIGKSE